MLHLLGIPSPATTTGRVLTEALETTHDSQIAQTKVEQFQAESAGFVQTLERTRYGGATYLRGGWRGADSSASQDQEAAGGL